MFVGLGGFLLIVLYYGLLNMIHVCIDYILIACLYLWYCLFVTGLLHCLGWFAGWLWLIVT